MSTGGRLAVIAALAAAVVVVLALKSGGPTPEPAIAPRETPQRARIVDLGRGKCIPCQMMEPVLEELRRDYGDSLEVVYIDIVEDAERASEYEFRIIPTQILFDAEGNELARHEGYWPTEEILQAFREHGVEL